MFSRSKQTPLFLAFCRLILSPSIVDLIFDNMHRAYCINLYLTTSMVMGSNKTPSAMPWLTELSLGDASYGQDHRLPYLDTFFVACDIIRLSRLKLNNCVMAWNHPIYRQGSLTHLSVSYRLQQQRKLVVFEDFLKVLRNAPMLEQIHLEHTLPCGTVESETSDVIPLTHLHSLRLTDHLLSCTHVLRRIWFPRTAEIFIQGFNADEEGAAALGREIGTKIGQSFDEKEETSLDLCSFSIKQTGSTRIHGFSDECTIDQLKNEFSYGQLRLWVEVWLHGDHSSRICHALCAGLPLSLVQTLYLEARMEDWMPDFLTMAKSLPDVRTLGIRSSCPDWSTRIPELLAVQKTDGGTQSPPAHPGLLPALAFLELFDIEFRDDQGSPDDMEVLSKYHSMFSLRANAGAKIRELELHRPINIFQEDVRYLETAVGRVVWNPRQVRYVKAESSDDEESVTSEMVRDADDYMGFLAAEDLDFDFGGADDF